MGLVSVIIPVYKVEKHLDRCVTSILNQTEQDFEIILVDDGSPDRCPQICDAYAQRYKNISVIHKKNGGLSDARNAGIEYALCESESEYITFIDSDDWIHPQYLEFLIKAIIEANSDISCCKPKRISSQEEMKSFPRAEVCAETASELYLSKKIDITSAWGKLYKKELFQELRFPKGKLFEDDWIIPMLLFSGVKISAIQNELYYYFQNSDGITGTSWSQEKFSACLEPLRVQIEFMNENGFYDILKCRCRVYADVLIGNSKKHAQVSGDKKYMAHQLRLLKKTVMKYKEYIPEIERYGFTAWAYRKTYIIENFEKDFQNVKTEKGLIFAYLWKIRNIQKVYKEIKNDT